jgi:phosphoribosylaminoimidazole-succinocarboxamide synthase
VAAERGLILVDTKYEMGYDKDRVLTVGDEVHTPDSSRYWVASSYEERFAAGKEPESLDKEFFRLWLKEQGFKDFDWQDGFGAFSLGQSQRGETVDYFRRQQIKHATVSFQDEFLDFLQRYEVAYDERYVWG